LDLTALAAPLTGRERTLEQLRTVDERVLMHHGLDVEQMQAPMLHALDELGPQVPEPVLRGLDTALNLARYGWFCWQLNTVSLFWSLSTLEKGLCIRLNKELERSGLGSLLGTCQKEGLLNPDTPVILDLVESAFWWGSKKERMRTAIEQTTQPQSNRKPIVVPDSLSVLVGGLPALRNHLAHSGCSDIYPIGTAQRGFLQVCAILKQLW
jgi:hypothetical protein